MGERTPQRAVLMVSAAGGIDIEEVAAKTPEKLHRLAVDPRYGLLAHQALGLALRLYRDIAQARAAADIMQRLYAAFYAVGDRKSTRLNSSHQIISYAVFCLKKKIASPDATPRIHIAAESTTSMPQSS